MAARVTYFRRILLVLTVFVFSACVKYSFKGSLPSSLKTISIPSFEDRSTWIGLQELLSEGVVNAFIDDNTLKLIDDESAADLLLLGTVVGVRSQKTSISQDQLVEEEQLVVSVKVECLNQQTDEPLWTGNISEFGVVSGDGTLEERDAAIDQAVEKIIEEILNRTVAAW